MNALVFGGLIAAAMLASGSSSASASAPQPPALPKAPLGKPPAKAPAKAAAKPAAKPAAAPPARPDFLFPLNQTPAAAPVKTPAQAAAVKAPKAKPLGKAVAKTAAQKQPAQPAGGVKASPVLEPNRGSLPAGYEPAKAKSRARAMAAHLAKKGPASYSHAELKSWQTQAGLTPDGLYGGSSRGALIYFGVADPPRPFSKPVATLPYVPPEQRLKATT